ncbi:DASS family sodium-coupled anion symporter [Bifidobacterium catulorum]|uniref:Anion permease n=1 Tax=Bifidobacterium catulorum TaxID=1630173 RepID=A0A2U2MUJ9_9BIFI|nr:DASS family sodium-coupled anion symporter [Bifidobacterium catulorum]PWG60516.1 anion permease [Bifidobacterium catulorum]
MTQATKQRTSQLIKAAVCVAITAAIYVIPPPEGLEPRAMHMLAIFLGTILGLILQPLPTSAIAIIGLTVAMLTGAMDPKTEAFAGLGSASIWLIVAAFFIAQGFVKTGLGRRIALVFISLLGKSTLGISYGLSAADLLLAPATPSNTARLGGILFPIITSISDVQRSTPESDESRRRIGAYLAITANNVNAVTSAMFTTAMAAGPVVAQLAADSDVTIGWGTWALAGIVPGVLCLLIIPALVYKVYPPTIRHVPTAQSDARAELRNLGRLSVKEWIMAATFVIMLVLWATGSMTGINATTVAFLGVTVLLVSGIITWKDMAANTSAWSTLIFFGVLVGMATPINDLGVAAWAGEIIARATSGMPWMAVLALLTVCYFLMHYLFAAELAQAVALYTLFLGVAVAAGAPPLAAALMLGCTTGLIGAMTHYASGPAALIYGAGYVKTPEFLKIGLLCGIVCVAVWITLGMGWWKIIGIW